MRAQETILYSTDMLWPGEHFGLKVKGNCKISEAAWKSGFLNLVCHILSSGMQKILLSLKDLLFKICLQFLPKDEKFTFNPLPGNFIK